MKKMFALLAAAILLGFTKNPRKYAEIYLKSDKTQFIEVRNAIEDIYMWDMKNDTIYPNENNEFIFKKVIDKPEFVTIKIGKKRLKSILLPGSKIEIDQVGSQYTFKGKNKAGTDLLNKLKSLFFSFDESHKYRFDTTAVQIKQRIQTQKAKKLKELQKLRQHNQIEKQFSKVLKVEIDYFYALKTIQIILDKQYKKMPISRDLLELFEIVKKKYPLNIDYKPSSWLQYADHLLLQKPLYDLQANNTITKASLKAWYKNDQLIPYQYNLISKQANPKIVEKVLANFIMDAAKQDHFEKSLIAVFKKYKKTYPNSPYSKYLNSEIQIIKNYYQKISGDMPKDIEFIDGQHISTMKQLLGKIKGKKYYVDVWATWCGPCKRQFKFNKELNALLKAKGYKKLYISLDKAAVEKKWKQDIKYYDLNGVHMRASLDFFKHFAKNYSLQQGYVSIPQYLIIDEKSNIITNNAPKPSNLAQLKKVLSK